MSFRNTDLSESTLCWNDFADVDFTDADLRAADLRDSIFQGCTFVGADLRGAKLARAQASQLALSPEQQAVVVWNDDEPDGG